MGQIQRIAFQRLDTANNTFGSNLPANDITVLADWQTYIAAADDTKIVVTPVIGANPVIEAGDAITAGGGDNSTLNGVQEVQGTNPSAFSTDFNDLTTEIEVAMKTLQCEKKLTAYFFLKGKKVAALKIDATNQRGFDIQSLFFSDRNNAGFGTKDTHTLSFSLPSGWSQDLQILDLAFDPITDL
jgi:hypothetical protein